MKRRAAIAVAIALVLLALFVVAVGWEEVLSAIARAELAVYAVAFLGTLGTFGFRTAVWARVLAVVDRPRPYWLLLGVFLTASFLKYVTPYGQLTSGVGVAAIVSRYTDAAYEESLAGVVSADFLNYLPYYTFGLVGAGYLILLDSPPAALGEYALPVVGLVGAVVALAALLWRKRGLFDAGVIRAIAGLRGLVGRLSTSKARLLTRENVERRLEGFYTTLELVSADRRAMAAALVYAHLGWLGLAVALYASAHALAVPLPFGVAMLVVAVSKLGFLLPTPGGIGGVEATTAGALYVVAPTSVAVATATAILFRFATYWFTVLVGGGASMALTVRDPLPPESY